MTDSHREEIRRTLRAMSDSAIAYQMAHGAPGGIDREEIEAEHLRRDLIALGKRGTRAERAARGNL